MKLGGGGESKSWGGESLALPDEQSDQSGLPTYIRAGQLGKICKEYHTNLQLQKKNSCSVYVVRITEFVQFCVNLDTQGVIASNLFRHHRAQSRIDSAYFSKENLVFLSFDL